jgi:CheY-like chemotaxis protein
VLLGYHGKEPSSCLPVGSHISDPGKSWFLSSNQKFLSSMMSVLSPSTLATILTQSGFIATAFTNPLEALQAAETDCPDLLISDVVMPELSGIDLAIQTRVLCSACKVLLFSGMAATSDLLEVARKNGHNFELLSKPVHPADLLGAKLSS